MRLEGLNVVIWVPRSSCPQRSRCGAVGRQDRISRPTRAPDARMGKCSSKGMIATVWRGSKRLNRPMLPINRIGSSWPNRSKVGVCAKRRLTQVGGDPHELIIQRHLLEELQHSLTLIWPRELRPQHPSLDRRKRTPQGRDGRHEIREQVEPAIQPSQGRGGDDVLKKLLHGPCPPGQRNRHRVGDDEPTNRVGIGRRRGQAEGAARVVDVQDVVPQAQRVAECLDEAGVLGERSFERRRTRGLPEAREIGRNHPMVAAQLTNDANEAEGGHRCAVQQDHRRPFALIHIGGLAAVDDGHVPREPDAQADGINVRRRVRRWTGRKRDAHTYETRHPPRT